jgi:hypothetical protein
VSRDERTYGGVADKYDEWVELESRPAQRERIRRTDPHEPKSRGRGNSDMSRLVFAAIGFGIALVLFILALVAFSTASSWAGYDRDGAAVGYILVGVFLLIASIGGAAAIYNHNFRVLVRPPSGHGH